MMAGTDQLHQARSFFPHLKDGIIYMNHAATGPYSQPVRDAMDAYMQDRLSDRIENYPDLLSLITETLESIASVIHARAEQVEFTPNTSYGLNVLAGGISWKPGDRIIIPSCEFPANVYPFLQLQARGVEIDFVSHQDGTFSVEDIKKRITDRTRLVTLSWVQFLSGFRCDIEEIGALCKKHDILFSVDGIQGLGALSIDVQKAGIDFLSTGGHKWLLSTQGIGFIYVSERLFERLNPVRGWLNGPVDWDNLMDYKMDLHPDMRRFRLGTLNGLGITALHASLGLYKSLGQAWCEENLISVTMYLRDRLRALGFTLYGVFNEKYASGISTFIHPESGVIYEHLRQNNMHIALRNKMLRFSPGYYSSSEDVDRVLDVIESVLNR